MPRRLLRRGRPVQLVRPALRRGISRLAGVSDLSVLHDRVDEVEADVAEERGLRLALTRQVEELEQRLAAKHRSSAPPSTEH